MAVDDPIDLNAFSTETMISSATDVSTRIEYCADQWFMDKVPWALWFCAFGLAIALNAPGNGYNAPFLALGYLVLLGIVFAGMAAIMLVDEKASFLPSLVLWVVIVAVVSLIVAVGAKFLGGSVGRSVSHKWWADLVDPPANVFGWMMAYLGVLWSGWSVYRHHHPGRPIIALGPEGLVYDRLWLQNLLIPWHEVREVIQIDPPIGITPPPPPPTVALSVSQAFYDRVVAPKLSLLAPPGYQLFVPVDGAMRMTLSHPELTVPAVEFRSHVEARWKAFRERAPGTSVPAVAANEPVSVFGRWTPDWYQLRFLLPVAAMAVIVIHAMVLAR